MAITRSNTRVLLDTFSKYLPITVNKDLVKAVNKMCITFETKKQHPNALNTNLFGVYPIYFLPEDYRMLFDIVGISQDRMAEVLNLIPNSVINPEFHVESDPHNLLTTWVAHNILVSKLSDSDKKIALSSIYKVMLYKFFTGLRRSYLPHGADPETMQATVSSLSNKFDIIQYKTWKGVIEAKAEDIYHTKSIHYRSLLTYRDDGEIKYSIIDPQTRLRNKLKTLLTKYYETKQMGDKVKTYKLVTELDAERVVWHMSTSFASVVDNTYTEICTPSLFINQLQVKLISDLYKNVSPDTFKRLLTKFSDTAIVQLKGQSTEDILVKKKEVYYVGIHKLISEFIQKTYRYCVLNKVPLTNKYALLEKVRDIYASSRITDEDILTIKRSIYKFVVDTRLVSKEATNASLTLGLVTYLLLKTFEYIK